MPFNDLLRQTRKRPVAGVGGGLFLMRCLHRPKTLFLPAPMNKNIDLTQRSGLDSCRKNLELRSNLLDPNANREKPNPRGIPSIDESRDFVETRSCGAFTAFHFQGFPLIRIISFTLGGAKGNAIEACPAAT